MTREDITRGLFELQDNDYRTFHARLMPEIDPERIIGVRTPQLRAFAKQVIKDSCAEEFLQELPHYYYEENNLHGALLNLRYKKESELEDFLKELERFLPYVDNWATCDMLSPKLFKKNLPLVYERVKHWLNSEHTYTIRFGIVTLLGYYLEDVFESGMLKLVCGVKSEEYYVRMAVAWYFSMALVKQYEETIPYFEQPVLETWTHNKAIQKAIESRRIDEGTKAYLRSLKI